MQREVLSIDLSHHFPIAVSLPGRSPAPAPGDPSRLSGHRRGPCSHLALRAQPGQHGSLAAARAADPRLGAVVVATHSREWLVGQVVDVTIPVDR